MNASAAVGPSVVPDVDSPAQDKKSKPKPKTQPRQKASRESKPNKTLPTERIGFDKQLEILRAYAAGSSQGSKSVALEELARLMKMSPTTVTMANPFLSSIGFISRTDTGYMPAPDVLLYQRAYDWNRETAGHKLAPIVEASWFYQAIRAKLELAPTEEEEVIATLGQEANAGQEYRRELKTLIEYMLSSGLIQREGSQLRTRQFVPVSADSSPPPTKMEVTRPATGEPEARRSISTGFTKTAEGAVHFNVSVKVDMEQFAGWQPERITAFFGGIAAVLRAKSGIEIEEGS